QHVFAVFVALADIDAAQNSALFQLIENFNGRTRQLQDKLIEIGAVVQHRDAGNGAQAVSQVMRAFDADLGRVVQSLRSQQCDVNKHGQRVQCLVGADVRGGF